MDELDNIENALQMGLEESINPTHKESIKQYLFDLESELEMKLEEIMELRKGTYINEIYVGRVELNRDIETEDSSERDEYLHGCNDLIEKIRTNYSFIVETLIEMENNKYIDSTTIKEIEKYNDKIEERLEYAMYTLSKETPIRRIRKGNGKGCVEIEWECEEGIVNIELYKYNFNFTCEDEEITELNITNITPREYTGGDTNGE